MPAAGVIGWLNRRERTKVLANERRRFGYRPINLLLRREGRPFIVPLS